MSPLSGLEGVKLLSKREDIFQIYEFHNLIGNSKIPTDAGTMSDKFSSPLIV